jgi:hypothetical protein
MDTKTTTCPSYKVEMLAMIVNAMAAQKSAQIAKGLR